MCGIVYYFNKNGQSVNQLVKCAYKAQRSRGSDGFGFFTPNNNRLTHNVDERGILRLLKRTRQSEILFHHRFPTSTSNVRNACHPFSTKNFYKHNYVMVHNGVIYNDDDVAKTQFNEGVHYVSKQPDGRFNDSEVLMYDLADYIEGKTEILTVEGSIAFVMVQLDKKGNRKALYFGRNSGNPLKLRKYAHGFSLTSEGEGEMVEENQLHKYNYKTGKFSSTPLRIPYYTYSLKKYSDYDDRYEYGEYMGYDKGYNWESGRYINHVGYDKYNNKIDQNGYLVPDEKQFGVFTEQVLNRYKDINTGCGSNETEYNQAVKEVKNALMYDMNYATDVAIDFAILMLDQIQPRYDELENMITTENTTRFDLDEYLELSVQMELLGKAIDILADEQLRLSIKDGIKGLLV